MDDFKCTRCSRIFDFDSRYPIFCQLGRVCKECALQLDFPLTQSDDAFLNNLKNELLTVTCHHTTEYMPQAYALDSNILEVYCQECTFKNPNLIILPNHPARSYFRNELGKIQSDKYPPEYISEFKRYLTSSDSVDDILKFFRRKLSFDSKQYICPIHLKEAQHIDINTFVFKCAYCTPTSTMKTISTQESINQLLAAAINVCVSAKTSALRTYVMRFFHNYKISSDYFKNFFLEMRHVVEDSEARLSESSRCLQCGSLFGVGRRLPIKLHSEEKHEICLDCYEKRILNCCPLDQEPFPQKPQPLYVDYLFSMNLFCVNNHRDNRFSYNKKIFPYQLDCDHNICEKCYQDSKQANCCICTECLKPSISGRICKNKDLVSKLKFLEMFCTKPQHEGEIARYFNHEGLEAYCEKCNPINFKRFTNPIILLKPLDDELIKLHGTRELSEKFLSLPLRIKYKMVKGMTQMYFNRFKELRPYPGSRCYWFIDSFKLETFILKSNAAYELLGIVVSKPLRSSRLIVGVNGSEVYNDMQPFSNDTSNCLNPIIFSKALLLTATASLSIAFDIGEYFYGVDYVNYFKLDEKLFVKIISTTNNSGNHKTAGPFLGIIVSNVFFKLSVLGLKA